MHLAELAYIFSVLNYFLLLDNLFHKLIFQTKNTNGHRYPIKSQINFYEISSCKKKKKKKKRKESFFINHLMIAYGWAIFKLNDIKISLHLLQKRKMDHYIWFLCFIYLQFISGSMKSRKVDHHQFPYQLVASNAS